jgi:hypothetical protein
MMEIMSNEFATHMTESNGRIQRALGTQLLRNENTVTRDDGNLYGECINVKILPLNFLTFPDL